MQETCVHSLDQEDPLEKEMTTNNILQYFCLGNPMDRGTWWTVDHGVARELDTTYPLSIVLLW